MKNQSSHPGMTSLEVKKIIDSSKKLESFVGDRYVKTHMAVIKEIQDIKHRQQQSKLKFMK